MLSLSDRLEGGILGLLVGDALGVPYEFHGPEEIPEFVEMDPPHGFNRAHPGIAPGTWSDDGAQALALLDSLLERKGLNEADLGTRLCKWLFEGDYSVDANTFDAGLQTRRALEVVHAGGLGVVTRPLNDTSEHSQGNGSLMRSLPLALWHKGDQVRLLPLTFTQSAMTHWHLNTHLCCAIYCFWAQNILNGENATSGWFAAITSLERILEEQKSPARQFLDTITRWNDPPRGTEHVIDALLSASHVVRNTDDYESAVRAAIALGNDTDTTACIAGGIAGVLYGKQSIPRRWREELRGREIYRPLLEELIAWRQTK